MILTNCGLTIYYYAFQDVNSTAIIVSHMLIRVCAEKKLCQPSAVVKNVESQGFHSLKKKMNKMLSSLLVKTSECQGLSYLFICPYSSACVLNSMTGGWSRISSLLSTESFVKPDPNNTNWLFRAWDMKLLLDDKVVIGERTVQSHVNTTDKA